MAITPTLLTNGHFPVSGAGSVLGASITPVAGKTHLATLMTTSPIGDCTHTITGNGLTWTLLQTQQVNISGGTGRLSIFQGTGTASAGQTTFDWTGTDQNAAWWSVIDWSEAPTVRNADSKGWSPAGVVTTETVTLPAFASGDSIAFVIGFGQNGSVQPASGYTELYNDDFPGAGQTDASYRINDNSVDLGMNVGDYGCMVVAELAPAATPGVGMIRA